MPCMKVCRWTLLSCVVLSLAHSLAQDLAPRAYLITPVHSNAITLSYSFFSGNIIFDGAVPITGATAKVNVTVLSLTHSLRFFGRSANITTVSVSRRSRVGVVVGIVENVPITFVPSSFSTRTVCAALLMSGQSRTSPRASART